MSDTNNGAAGQDTAKRLGMAGLAAIVVSSMIGGGIYSLPQNMADTAGVGAVAIAWVITGIGMFFIANTFRTLASARPTSPPASTCTARTASANTRASR